MSIFDVFKKATPPIIKSEEELIQYDSIIYFIPEDINFKLSSNEIEQIKSLFWDKNNISFESNDAIQFADAGENFESVNCPFCKVDLMECWGEEMDSCYEEDGFTCLDIITPCCQKKTSLHNLVYYFPQGFYNTMIIIEPQFEHTLTIEQLAIEIHKITAMQWRIIQPHY